MIDPGEIMVASFLAGFLIGGALGLCIGYLWSRHE